MYPKERFEPADDLTADARYTAFHLEKRAVKTAHNAFDDIAAYFAPVLRFNSVTDAAKYLRPHRKKLRDGLKHGR